ncbi:MAG TPA: saccharopine dehydrogenase NADP-binding domain-containing protein [Synergistaceae bacterium]|nr:saccharopine dehydrogenase NADP-binding domain-containing protein [Synergistaceae bacterium]HPJ24521.1 saccharopine dehydrogenase NADP-binding domain-containing protein [Synergistaceae bacterium]HPQ36278.1 saccharopine dehydrogenase NADP-binding domain-containing protein [Synergistaceae bacterium]
MEKKRVLQLGYGMQGKCALQDLLRNSSIEEIIVTDCYENFEKEIAAIGDSRILPRRVNAEDTAILASLMKGVHVVVELLPGIFALPVAKLAAEQGVSLVTSMYLKNPGEQDADRKKEQARLLEEIDSMARKKKITILQEFGMDPGMDLVLGKQTLEEFEEVQAFHSYGAGFPEKSAATNPLRYKFTWSIIGVMRSYLRPATLIHRGEIQHIEAEDMFSSSSMHHLDIPELGGPLECFPNGDSAHFAELFGLSGIEEMGRYICRWPGHGAFWEIMAKCGFLKDSPLSIGDTSIAPTAFCAALLGSQKQFFYEKNEKDVALIRTDVRGIRQGKPCRVIYQIVDTRDCGSGFTAMQRTVGFPVSMGASMILDGTLTKTGVIYPMDVPFEPYKKALETRGIHIVRQELPWNGDCSPEA